MESPVQAGYQSLRQIRVAMGSRDAERNTSSEVREPCVKKSRYCLYRTRTVNRHRWMERILRPAEEALSKELGKMTPLPGEGATEKWPQRIGSSSCLKNTGLCETERWVYGLTPARCWKVGEG